MTPSRIEYWSFPSEYTRSLPCVPLSPVIAKPARVSFVERDLAGVALIQLHVDRPHTVALRCCEHRAVRDLNGGREVTRKCGLRLHPCSR